ncbi:MAG: ABC transporter permease, partial [Spirochaetia bacterium]
MNASIIVNFLFKGLEMSCPIAFAALGGVFSEKSGVINIALEGFMIVTAFSVVWGAVAFQTIWMGMVFALVAGVLMSLIHAVATITFRVNQIVSGVAINILAVGVGRFLSERVFGQETQSAINPFLFPTVMGINSFAFALIPIAIISWFVLYKTV